MASFSSVSDTSATISAGFNYASYTTELVDAAWSVADSISTVFYDSPYDWDFPTANSWGAWWDGTELYATLSSWSATSATVTDLDLYAPDGAWLAISGSAKIQYDSFGEITDVSNFSMKSLVMGNDYAATILAGSMTLNVDAGTVSGKLNAITMGWQDDDPNTVGIEWSYVTLKGSVSIGGDVLGGTPSLSGKITGVEWGTLVDNGNVTWIPAGSASGLKLDASATSAALANGGFEGLSAGLYSGNDTITGTAGNDFLDAFTGNDKVSGGEGADEIFGGAGNDQLTGGTGDDYIDGGAGNDKISDDSGDNTIIDESGNAQITLGAGNDDVYTGAGNDKINAGDGVNWVESGAGNDNITTGAHADFIFAGSGNDKIVAGNGDNWIDGGAGNDTITTGAGADLIYGGEGADKINGGGGSDVFVFDNLAVGGKDTINDFNAAEDFFAFDTTVFGSLAGGITAENVVVGAKAAALETDDYLIFDTQGGKLYYDADGSGAGAAVQIAVVKGSVSTASSGNFIDETTLFA
ncbi:calcium-binding protein [Aromatoleum petrolei]|uniref:Calcium-binding protein n=1 Tax=Aromatoleum petrolei TaxID=76116 RepID=A0ABX1MUB6_9RHOO|nr:calcium-binding protein [Aromatoleum petrolei]NMF91353.1 calcium-binding protein [Aromatoleum petrolei]QTQ36862.1 Hemolysin-type calcium-binding repeat domain-containing protein [Aromatoleum petrolei]